MILSSGPITNALGWNDDTGWTAHTNHSADLGKANDANLDELVGGGTSADAAVLAFDIISTNAFILQFQYVFASEEYPEFSDSPFNDPMAIFVSTNRQGTQWVIETNNNIALLPCTTNEPVTVNKLHGGCIYDVHHN